MKNKKLLGLFLLCLLVTAVIPSLCFANATMPWDTPLTNLQNDLQGPVATGVVVIVIIMTGLMIAFGEAGAAGRKMMQIVFGIACALGGVKVIIPIFGSVATGLLF
jgi:type IV secretory pathway VirB2 component (pilin)